MDKNELFSIGDIAKMYNLSVGSLRHYETAGLLTPEYTDPETGYRYYGPRQFEVLNTICYLRVLDMPLSKISEFINNRDVETIEKMLEEQKSEVVKKRLELERIERKIDNRLRQIKDASTSETDKITEVKIPQMRISSMREKLQPKGYLDMEKPIRSLGKKQEEATVFLGKVGIGISAEKLKEGNFDEYDRIFLILDDEEKGCDVTTLPETDGVCIRFHGSHADSPSEYKKLMAYISENGLETADFSREITIIDDGFTKDRDKFITEITIPVRRKNGNKSK